MTRRQHDIHTELDQLIERRVGIRCAVERAVDAHPQRPCKQDQLAHARQVERAIVARDAEHHARRPGRLDHRDFVAQLRELGIGVHEIPRARSRHGVHGDPHRGQHRREQLRRRREPTLARAAELEAPGTVALRRECGVQLIDVRFDEHRSGVECWAQDESGRMNDGGPDGPPPFISRPASAAAVQRLHPWRNVGFTHSDGGVAFLIIPVSGSITSDCPMRVARHPITIISVIGPA